jgi:chemotaxis protein MotB
MRLHQRLRRDQGRHTADDWLITYADTITLLLCLFVVILSIKTSGDKGRHETLVPAIPVAVVSNSPVMLATGSPPASAARVMETDDIFGGNSPFPAARAEQVVVADDPGPQPSRAESTVPDWVPAPFFDVEPVAQRVESPKPVVQVVEHVKPGGAEGIEAQGARITTMLISSAAFFGSGDAALSLAGKSILRDVAVTLKSERYAGYHISIEGHTDDMPINTAQFQSNWELSTARAVAVVRFFLEQGIAAAKLTAAGYADTFPIAPNRTADGAVIAENQASNRRVVIKLEKIDQPGR